MALRLWVKCLEVWVFSGVAYGCLAFFKLRLICGEGLGCGSDGI